KPRIHTGRCAHRSNAPYCSVVWACIVASSSPAINPAATALQEKSKCSLPSRCLNRTSKYIPATVKQNAASIDQSIVIQLIGREPEGRGERSVNRYRGETSSSGLDNRSA